MSGGEVGGEFDLAACDRDVFARGRIASGTRANQQADDGAFFTFDFAHNVAEPHVDHVFEFAVFTLGDAEDLVLIVQETRFFSRATGENLFDRANPVVVLKHGADANEGILHCRVEAFQCVGRQEAGVRVEQLGHRIDERFLYLRGFSVDDVGEVALVAAADLFACSIEGLG